MFMLFFNLYGKCRDEREYVEEQMKLGLDPLVHVGHLNHTMHLYGMLHPDVRVSEWMEEKYGVTYFCRRLDTPAGPLTGKVRQREGWPTRQDFPLLKDWIVPRAEEVLVKPEEDLEKVKYLFGPFRDGDIEVLREEARAAKAIADKHGLYLIGGWKGHVRPGLQVDPGVMGADTLSWLSGYENIMVLSVTSPQIVREYVEIVHRWNMRQLEIYIDATDAELILRRAWYETTEFWTPQAYREILAPVLRKETDLVHQAGRKLGYIISSAFLPILDEILDAGVDVLIGLDPKEGKGTDLGIVKRKCEDKKRAIWGGVSGAITVEQGTEKETEEAVFEALSVLGKGGGFILSPVDNVREDTENAWRNTRVFIETWKKFRVSCL
jgi:hypothetical protein